MSDFEVTDPVLLGDLEIAFGATMNSHYRYYVKSIFSLARKGLSAAPEALRREPDPLTLELADELFGCFLSRATPDADHSWECAVCEQPVTMPNWVISKHAEDCAVAKARDYLAIHAPHRTPGYTPSPLARRQEKPDADGWIAWAGGGPGEMPVSHETPVEVRWRDGSQHTDQLADYWSWGNSGDEDDIVAYRLSPPQHDGGNK